MTAALTPADLGQFKRLGSFEADYPANVRRFFSPDDDVHGALVSIVKSAASSLECAMYGWDDDELDELFREAWQDEHVRVTLCLDRSQAGGVHERLLVAKWTSDPSLNSRLVVGTSRKHAISHTKMLVVDGLVVCGGSTNWSTSGETLQNNELTVIFDRTVAHEASVKVQMTHDEMAAQPQPVPKEAS